MWGREEEEVCRRFNSHKISVSPLLEPQNDFEAELLRAKQPQVQMQLLAGQIEFSQWNQRRCAFVKSTERLYRLDCPLRHVALDFALVSMAKGEAFAHVKMLNVLPEFQGSFWRLKSFLEDACHIVFQAEHPKILGFYGDAFGNQLPVRGKDWRDEPVLDGTTKLVRMYQRLGGLQLGWDEKAIFILSSHGWQQVLRRNLTDTEKQKLNGVSKQRPLKAAMRPKDF